MEKNVIALILAAGESNSINTEKSILTKKIYGKELIKRVVETVAKSGIKEIITVVSDKEEIKKVLGDNVKYIKQDKRLGTGDAILQADEYLKNKEGKIIVINANVPILKETTLIRLLKRNNEKNESATVLTAIYNNPTGYGRIIRNLEGNIEKIVEETEATEEEIRIQEVNSGIYCFDIQLLLKYIRKINSNNSKKEYYLTDIIKIMNDDNLSVGALIAEDNTEVLKVKDNIQLELLTKILKLRINQEFMKKGVIIEDTDNTYIYDDVKIGKDTIIHPNSTIKNDVIIGEECEIGPNSYIREGCRLSNKIKIGSFVEIKNAIVGDNTKIPHLSYMGDCNIGANVNIGCGTITCNYNGFTKNKTIIGSNSFIGSNVNLIAPVTIGENSFIAAGSTITDDVPNDSLAIARQRQINKDGWNKK